MSSPASKSDNFEAGLFEEAIVLAVVAVDSLCVPSEVLMLGPAAGCELSDVELLAVVLAVDEGENLTEPSLGREVDGLWARKENNDLGTDCMEQIINQLLSNQLLALTLHEPPTSVSGTHLGLSCSVFLMTAASPVSINTDTTNVKASIRTTPAKSRDQN